MEDTLIAAPSGLGIDKDVVAKTKNLRTVRVCGTPFAVRSPIIHYTLLEDVEVTLRYGAALAVILAIILFLPNDFVIEHFPRFFLMGITATLIILVPYTGAAWHRTLSWCLGALVSVFFAWLVTVIIGTATKEVTVMVEGELMCPANGTMPVPSMMEVVGQVSVHSPTTLAVILGVIIFFLVFFLSYVSTTQLWGSAAVVLFCINILTWYISMVEPLVPIRDGLDFLKVARTTMVGCAISALILHVPLPRFICKPRLLPRTRGALPQVLADLDISSAQLSSILNHLAEGYVRGGCFELIESLSRLSARIDAAAAATQRSIDLLQISGKWEPLMALPGIHFLPPWRIRPGTLAALLGQLQILCFQLRYLVNSFRLEPAMVIEDGYKWEGMDNEIFLAVRTMVEIAVRGLKATIGKPDHHIRIKEDLSDAMDVLDDMMADRFARSTSHTMDGELTNNTSELAFHCSCIWKLKDACATVMKYQEIMWETPPSELDSLYPLRVFDFALDWVKVWLAAAKDVKKVITRKIWVRSYVAKRHKWLSGSFQIACAAVVASLFILVTVIRDRIPSSMAVVSTALLIMDRDNPGVQFTKGMSRLTGTALAIGGAFLISVIWPEGNDLGTFLMVLSFGLTARFVMTNPQFADVSFAFIVALLAILFERDAIVLITNISVTIPGRATATVFGVIIATLANVLWPIHARTLIWYHLGTTTSEYLAPLSMDVLQIFTHERDKANPPIEEHIAGIKRGIKREEQLAKEALVEPQLWREPFPAAAVDRVIRWQRRLLNSLVPCQRMSQAFQEKLAEHDAVAKLPDIIQPEPWRHLEHSMYRKLKALAIALQMNIEVTEGFVYQRLRETAEEDREDIRLEDMREASDVPMIRSYGIFIEEVKADVKTAVIKNSLPSSAQVALWALLWNIKVVCTDVVQLRSAVDAVYDKRRASEKEGFRVFPCLN